MFYNLNKNVKILRLKKGLTQKSLSDEINISKRMLEELESGRSNCSLETLEKIRLFFYLSFDDLILNDLSEK